MVPALVGPHGAVAVEESDAVWDAAWHIRMLTAQVCLLLHSHMAADHHMPYLPMDGREAVLGIG